MKDNKHKKTVDGFEKIKFLDGMPYWLAVSFKRES
tara:strand:- start:1011 stop:1115 length:105 start_codon:yes stop_codon:yes gene_type:complete